ncbi:MAG TPA: hypothetical protein VM056_06330 [Terriglobales bacterium]|nr:hypothetical protein [Terriglobales bacterium]
MPLDPFKIFIKALGVAAVSAGIMFFFGVFSTIIVLLIAWGVSGSKPDLTIAYRWIGISLAIVAFVVGFITVLYFDFRAASKS